MSAAAGAEMKHERNCFTGHRSGVLFDSSISSETRSTYTGLAPHVTFSTETKILSQVGASSLLDYILVEAKHIVDVGEALI